MERLSWDSNFFEIEVYKTFFNNNLNNIIETVSFDLLYLISNSKIDINSINRPIQLVDKKVTFYKQLQDIKTDRNTEVISVNQCNNKLINLSIQSSEFSRFRIDDKINNNKVDELYTKWIENSLKRKLSFEVLTYSDEYKGLITLGEKNNRADIGLLAVDNKSRGLGIGKSLIKEAERTCILKNYKELQVVTQLDNILACNFYKSQGFIIDKIEYIYHIWNK
ncbi:GNAT family N-acetyltransferase [Flammeovirga sp. OC4]|uniref:GNAT family N-acetyltransferase n=1 Tax=Flammeovirga sp. OC4 TaxID=1382345 RepID=UPI0006949534|nr:GNAT family N-acetyltransferase [Flammeovirga sp. OC4]